MTTTGTISTTTSAPSSSTEGNHLYQYGIGVALLVIVCIVVGTIVHTKKVRKQKDISPPKPKRQRRRLSASSRKKNSKANYDVSLAGFGRAWEGRPRQEPNHGPYIFDDSSSGYLSLQGSETYPNCAHDDFARWSDSLSFQHDDEGYLKPRSDYYCIYVNVADLFADSGHGGPPPALEGSIPVSEPVTPKSTSTSLAVHPSLPSRQSIDTDGEETEESEESEGSEGGIEYVVTPFCRELSRIRAHTTPRALTNPRLCKALKELSDNHEYITAL